MSAPAPGTYRNSKERWGRFDVLCASLGRGPILALADARVLRLHTHVGRALRGRKAQVLRISAGEAAKSLARIEALALEAASLPRATTLLAIGGGTVGDVATVFVHLFKRGLRHFIQVPTTLLAAVDSSMGGKGAVNVGRMKNTLGVFHFADESWLCPELYTTLSTAQRREGCCEAWKTVLTLRARVFSQWRAAAPSERELIRQARLLKEAVVREDPYETNGRRMALNFGHTFGHVLESATGFRMRHGKAVGLGMLCALDVGRALQVTSEAVAESVEAVVCGVTLGVARWQLARALSHVTGTQVAQLLKADKKSAAGETRMVLLQAPGKWTARQVTLDTWRPLLRAWQAGWRP